MPWTRIRWICRRADERRGTQDRSRRRRDPRGDGYGTWRGETPLAAEDRGEVAALHQLHHDVRAGSLGPEVEHGHHVRVRDRCGAAGLCDEARAEDGVVGQVRPHQLQRHLAAELCIARAMHSGHSTVPQQLLDLVSAADQCAGLGHRPEPPFMDRSDGRSKHGACRARRIPRCR